MQTLLAAQTLIILYRHTIREKYILGIYAAVTALAILIFTSITATKLVHEDVYTAGKSSRSFLVITRLVACLITTIAFLNVKRRPIVYLESKPVDQEYTSSVIGRFTLSWASSTLKEADKNNRFTLDSLPRISNYMRSRFLLASFENDSQNRSLGDAVFRFFSWAFVHQVSLTVVTNITQLGPQYAMFRLLLHLEQKSQGSASTASASIWVIGLAFCMFFNSIAESWLSWVGWSQIAIPLRAILSISIFTKSLRRKDVKMAQNDVHAELEPPEDESPMGSILAAAEERTPPPVENPITRVRARPEVMQSTNNLIAVDCQRISGFSSVCWFFPASVVRLCLSVYFLYFLIGWQSLLAGVVAWLATMPLNAFISKRYSSLQGKMMRARDGRVAIIAEALQNIRQIKFAAQEDQWRAKIGHEREQELGVQWRSFQYQTVFFCLLIAGPVLLSSFSLLTYAYLYGSLRPSIAFTALAIFGHLEFTLTVIPRLIMEGIDAWVSLRRVGDFLAASEKVPCTIQSESQSITFKDASIRWPSDSEHRARDQFVLSHIKLTFPPNELSVISGRTGSGKSLLLAAIIGEADKLAGPIEVPQRCATDKRFATKDNWIVEGLIALVPQSPWIEPTTIRQNILFGLPMNRDRYQETLSACALLRDLNSLTDGDLTDIGPKGVNLSGGQRSRIAFARALYSRAGTLVMDDILSSLDAQVGRHIIEKALISGLGSGRTRILVTTHHVGFCFSKSTYHVVLGNGVVEFAGGSTPSVAGSLATEPCTEDETPRDQRSLRGRDVYAQEVMSHLRADHDVNVVPRSARRFTEDEKKETGGYRLGFYKEYLVSARGLSLWVLVLACFLGGAVLDVAKVSVLTSSGSNK